MQANKNLNIRLWLIVLAWFLYGQIIAAGLLSGYLNDIGHYVWEGFGQFIPSLARLEKSQGMLPRLHASLMLVSMPFLFAALMFADLESSAQGIRMKGTETAAAIFFLLIGSMEFFAGFGFRRFLSSFFAFSIGSSFLIATSAYCYRLAYCIVFQPPPQPAMLDEIERAVKVLSSFLESRANPLIRLPPLDDISTSIHSLSKHYRMDRECLPPLTDLESSPPVISPRLVAVATKLLNASRDLSKHP